jgi:methyltransferase (TIGR00027 family)
LLVFEVDRPGPQAWKRQRLIDLGFGIPSFLRFVPVDFEAGDTWWERLAASGFDAGRPAVVASTGVSMYLTKDAIAATLRQIAALAPGSTLVMSFMLPIELADPEVRPGIARAAQGGARKRHALHQLLHVDGDARAGPRSGLSSRPARVSSSSCPALLRRKD